MSIMWPVLLPSLGLAGYALLGWRQRGDTRDLRYGLVLLAWSALLVAGELGHLGVSDEVVRAATRGSYQLTILAVSAFLMAWVRGLGWGDKVLMASQAALGLFLAPLQAAALPAGWGQAWFWVNALGITALVLRLAHAIWRRTDAESWMVLLVAVLGLGVVLTDLRQAADGPALVSVSHYFFAVALFVLWLALTQRVGNSRRSIGEGGSSAHQVQRQLAQDLHDGVGSQLTTLISALDAGSPEQRATAATLQQCLLELKLLVDGINEEGSVVSHLASLRYRMQPLLAAAGMDLQWRLVDEEQLERAQGPAARQVLRVAQEALANAVRHSGADTVVLSCCHMNSADALLLEIADNGKGMAYERYARTASSGEPHRASHGKGLSGMVLRASQMHGQLSVESAPGEGTRVRLQVPMAALLQPTAERRRAPA